MSGMVGIEFRKLRTVRGPWLVLLAAQLVVVAGVSGLALSSKKTLDEAQQSAALAHVSLTAVFSLVFGIFAIAGEHRHRTITDTYLSTPRRHRAVIAKLVVYPIIGGLSGVLTSAIGIFTAAGWWAAKGATFSWLGGDMWTTLGGGIAANALFAAIGVGLGAVTRNLVGAVAVALAWIALVEGIVGQLVGDTFSGWLPFNAALALGGSATNTSTELLSRWAAAVVLIGYASAFVTAAVTYTTRRDVA